MKRELTIVITTPEIAADTEIAPYLDLATRAFLQRLRGLTDHEAIQLPSGMTVVADLKTLEA